MTSRDRGGRPSKGPRTRHTIVVPASLTPLVKDHCAAAGKTFNDFVVEAMAVQLGMTRQRIAELLKQPSHRQEEFPLNAA